MARAAPFLTLTEAAKYLRVSSATVYRLVKKRELPGFKVGRGWRFSRVTLDFWKERQELYFGQDGERLL